jgi:hypothetical protein
MASSLYGKQLFLFVLEHFVDLSDELVGEAL